MFFSCNKYILNIDKKLIEMIEFLFRKIIGVWL